MKRIPNCACLAILVTAAWLALPTAAPAQPPMPVAPTSVGAGGDSGGTLPPALTGASDANTGGRGGYGTAAAGTATIQPDPQTGSLVVIGDKATLDAITRVVKSLDKPVPQVLVKVLFLEVTHTNDLNLGAEGKVTRTSNNGETVQVGQTGFGLGLSDALAAAAAAAGATAPAHTALSGGGYYELADSDLQLTLRALATTTKLDVLSRPSVLVRNNEAANVTVGQQIPMITSSRVDTSGNTVNTIQYTNVGIILDVTPRITTGKMVEMEVAPQISALTAQTVPVSAGTNTVSAPVIAMRSATTTVIAQSGKTVVIGGMMQDNNTSSVDRVPILGDIPLLGHLFRHTVISKSKTELLIFLTPFIVESPHDLDEATLSESAKAEVSRTAFTPAEIDKYIENLKGWHDKPQTDSAQPAGQKPTGASGAPGQPADQDENTNDDQDQPAAAE